MCKRNAMTAAILVAGLLGGAAAAAQDADYKTLRTDREARDRSHPTPPTLDDPGADTSQDPVAQLHLRAFFRATYVTSRSDIGHDDSVLFDEAPDFNRAFSPGAGGGMDMVYTLIPMLSVQYNLTYQYFTGRTVSTNRDTEIDFGDLWIFETSIGPRLNFPLDLPLGLWTKREGMRRFRGLVPYLRLGLGYALSGEVEATFGGQQEEYFAASGSFHVGFAVGTEYHGERFGFFVEMFAVDRFGPLESVSDSAKSTTVLAFPFSMGVTMRF